VTLLYGDAINTNTNVGKKFLTNRRELHVIEMESNVS